MSEDKQIIQIPFNVTNPDLKAFSLDRGEIITARTNKFWWGFGTGEPVSVELTHKPKIKGEIYPKSVVYATGRARVINTTSMGEKSNIWIFYYKQAGFDTPEAWCKAFMRFRRGHKPKMIYVIEITDIKEAVNGRQ